MKNFKFQTPNSTEIPSFKLQMRNIKVFTAESAEVRGDSQRNSGLSPRRSASLCDLCGKIKTVMAAVCVGGSLIATPWTARSEHLLLSNAVVHTISGDTITSGQVLVVDGKISDVGPKVTAPEAKVVDLQGQHLYQGMLA